MVPLGEETPEQVETWLYELNEIRVEEEVEYRRLRDDIEAAGRGHDVVVSQAQVNEVIARLSTLVSSDELRFELEQALGLRLDYAADGDFDISEGAIDRERDRFGELLAPYQPAEPQNLPEAA